ncbi:ribosome maturation factor RimP [Bdellovibrionota bacterium FG-2]
MNSRVETEKQLNERITSVIAPLGFELVHMEVQNQREKILRLFIDKQKDKQNGTGGINVDDCAQVSHALDEPLENAPEIATLFKGAFELEVSSPGLDRPLHNASDYDRFSGQEARIHVFRPLTAEEIQNPQYLARNPKQKNFQGMLAGIRHDSVALKIKEKTKEEEIMIPLPLISKAHLEPQFGAEVFESQNSKRNHS